MRIREVAELAGVTIRTVRYYHQVGVLQEPPRRSNGYRDYTVDHLVALLRIDQLTSSGMSLAQAGRVVADSASVTTDETLDEVDRVLGARIAALTEQRERLALARAGHHVGLSRVAAALSVKSTDVPAATLLAHLYKDNPQIDLLAEALLAPGLRSALESLQERFDAIDETSTDSELDDLMARVRSVVAQFADDLPPLTDEQTHLILTLVERDLNDRQKEFVRREE